ncbi:MAG: ATP-binding protein [Candidatus Omnitrophica bacterium]|nr:ATP-binding protein [Candidatus Omnitrophota bacterium]
MHKNIVIESKLKNIKGVVSEIIGLLKTKKADESDIFDIRLSLEETLINAIKYGNKFDKSLPVSIDVSCEENLISITIEDKGEGFDYKGVPDPTEEENILRSRGRGVFLVKHIMDKVEYNKKGNRITMVKRLKTPK